MLTQHCGVGGVMPPVASTTSANVTSHDDDAIELPAFFSGAREASRSATPIRPIRALRIGGGAAYGSDEVGAHVGTFSLPPPMARASDDAERDRRPGISVLDAARDPGVSITRISEGSVRAAISARRHRRHHVLGRIETRR